MMAPIWLPAVTLATPPWPARTALGREGDMSVLVLLLVFRQQRSVFLGFFAMMLDIGFRC